MFVAVTRSFGDADIPWVTADPFVNVTEIGPQDTHVIIASDGVSTYVNGTNQ